MLDLHFEALLSTSGVFVRISRGSDRLICGSMFLSPDNWTTFQQVLRGKASPDEATLTITTRDDACARCTEQSYIRCPLCAELFCRACWGDHPHAYGVHIEGSTK